jgi:hypothetical protein
MRRAAANAGKNLAGKRRNSPDVKLSDTAGLALGLLRFGGVNRLPEQLGAERPRHRRSVAGPAKEIAAYADQ